MGEFVDRYLTLGLRLGRHVDGLVDAYYGPAGLAAAVGREELVEAGMLVAEAEALLEALASGDEFEPSRRAWLGDQLRALGVYARVLGGEELGYSDEVEGCYGVRPERGSEGEYREVHERLEGMLPGSGPLGGRYERWRNVQAVPADRIVPAMRDVAELLRTRTMQLLELPSGEGVVLEAVNDEPWWAFNYYLGALRSRVVVNVDVLTTQSELVALALHEVYPGHHTEHACKEQRLVRERGQLEESILLVPTPQALVSEGIAEVGLDVLLDDELEGSLEDVLRSHGLDANLGLAFEIDRTRELLRQVGLDAALLIHENGAAASEAQAYLEHWALVSPEDAAHSVRFITNPTWRAYAITYSAGRRLCRGYVNNDPARLRTLLTEQVPIADLLAALAT